jgi:hypothetical protein
MKNRWLVTLLAGLTTLVCAAAISAQTAKTPASSQYVVSAKAGGVNFVEGSVSVTRLTGVTTRVVEGDQIDVGDRVRTGPDGKAEVLLSPGSYLRLGPDSTFDFGSIDLENLKIDLLSGSAVLEVLASDDFRVLVRTPQSRLNLDYSGVYRVDVMNDGSAKLSVFKGRAHVGPRENEEIKAGRFAALLKTGISVAKFDRDTDDPLDIWSKGRAKELTKLNAKLQGRTLRDTLLTSFNRRGWGLGNSFGLWVFDPSYRGWLFLPFGYGWTSPYGWDYGFDLWQCRMPWYVWNTPNNPPPTTGGTGGGGGGTADNNAALREQRRINMHTPTMLRVPTNAARADSQMSNPFPDSTSTSSPSVSLPSMARPGKSDMPASSSAPSRPATQVIRPPKD